MLALVFIRIARISFRLQNGVLVITPIFLRLTQTSTQSKSLVRLLINEDWQIYLIKFGLNMSLMKPQKNLSKT
ncbi:MAG: hypothetical protein CVU42_07350 [Chloroflexi bacterium HGW-Chloroflexi-4]|nr:MAG: hypothetical protein CVU42_07350 [Chloroflexi bacterium HGW-Chloroflexi-4]